MCMYMYMYMYMHIPFEMSNMYYDVNTSLETDCTYVCGGGAGGGGVRGAVVCVGGGHTYNVVESFKMPNMQGQHYTT